MISLAIVNVMNIEGTIKFFYTLFLRHSAELALESITLSNGFLQPLCKSLSIGLERSAAFPGRIILSTHCFRIGAIATTVRTVNSLIGPTRLRNFVFGEIALESFSTVVAC